MNRQQELTSSSIEIPAVSDSEFTSSRLHQNKYRTRWVAWLFVVMLFMLSVAGIQFRNGAVEWLLFTMTSLIILISGILPWIASARLQYDRGIGERDWISEGEVSLKANVTRGYRVPLVWHAIADRFKNESHVEEGGEMEYAAVFSPLFHKQMSVSYTWNGLERGKYEAQAVTIYTGDWLGLTVIKKNLHIPQTLTVLPTYPESSERSYFQGFHAQSSIWNKNMLKHIPSSYAENINGTKEHEGKGTMVRPYREGDSLGQIDFRSMLKGMELRTKVQEADKVEMPHVILIDSFYESMQEKRGQNIFNEMLSWTLEDVTSYPSTSQVITGDWSYEYTRGQDDFEFRCLLAQLRPSQSLSLDEKLNEYAVSFPQNGKIKVYSANWRNAEQWVRLNELAWLKGNHVEIHFVTDRKVMTYGMREQKNMLNEAGVKVVWRHAMQKEQQAYIANEGVEQYAMG